MHEFVIAGAVCTGMAVLSSSIAVHDLGYGEVLPRVSQWLLSGEDLEKPVPAWERRGRLILMLGVMIPFFLLAPILVMATLFTPSPRWTDVPGAALALLAYGAWLAVVLWRIRRAREDRDGDRGGASPT